MYTCLKSLEILWNVQKGSYIEKEKIPHTGNTRMCLIQEYRFCTMSISQYPGCCQYHESISIPWVLVNTMSPYLYHESLPITWLYHESKSILWKFSIPWVHANTMSQFQEVPKGPRGMFVIIYHESNSIPWVLSIILFSSTRPCQYHDFMSIPWVLVNSKRYLKFL